MDGRLPNIRHFAALAATVRLGSLTRAARAVNLTQPALTQAIAGLEASLGVRLFDRCPGGMRATEPALLLAPRAEAAIAHIGSPRVTATQVFAFLALAKAGSYAGAAEATQLSAASLHRAVADLGVALGQRLADRRGRIVTLTTAGHKRARGFGLAMAELRAGLAEVAAWKGQAGGRIVIGAMPLCRARWLPETISRFTASHPGVGIAIQEGSHAELSVALQNGEVDFMLGALRTGQEAVGLVQEEVFVDRPAIIMRAGHPLEAAEDIATSMLTYPWILPNPNTPLSRYWAGMIGELGLTPPEVEIECGSVLTIRQLLFSSDALTLLSPDQVEIELQAGFLAALPTPVTIERMIGITTRIDWRPTSVHAAFLAALRVTGGALPR